MEKLNPLTVKVYDHSRRQVVTHLLDMCTTSGRDCGTSLAIFTKISSILQDNSIPWGNCVGFGVDNTSVNVGKHNSIMSRVLQEYRECYFMGCPCHLVHNIACHASECLQKATGLDVEDICIDTFYWFDKSSKRKGVLQEFCTFCDTHYREVVHYVSVRWLSLEHAVQRILLLYNSLQSYFRSEEESQPRFARLRNAFDDPMTEAYFLFYQAVLPTFTNVNLLLQREDPTIHLIADAIREFLKKLLSKFVKLQAIAGIENITDVDFANSSNHLSDSQVTIGFVTRNRLQHLLDAGDISINDQKKFFQGVKAFFTDATAQALKKLPFGDDVINPLYPIVPFGTFP